MEQKSTKWEEIIRLMPDEIIINEVRRRKISQEDLFNGPIVSITNEQPKPETFSEIQIKKRRGMIFILHSKT